MDIAGPVVRHADSVKSGAAACQPPPRAFGKKSARICNWAQSAASAAARQSGYCAIGFFGVNRMNALLYLAVVLIWGTTWIAITLQQEG
ncbi:hypothetical protein, partial [Escherichia coli]|uniref:hypothetical protein n=1 Tax=Escherichia coli TaxID=562 RepID=UPI002280204A